MPYITPITLKTGFAKYGKQYAQEQFDKKGIRRKASYRLFRQIMSLYLDIAFEAMIERGEDVVTPAGTFKVRQVHAPNFKSGGWSRDFRLLGGKKYGIHDFMKRGNKYPVIFFDANGQVIFRNYFWRTYLKVKYRLRRRLYEAFYDRGVEYKQIEHEPRKTRRLRKIWRDNRIVNVKPRNEEA